nr:DUF1016 N-terminal domain-containing protein [Rickettsia hoogstraalii]
MRRFAEEYRDLEFVQQVAAQLPWFHIVLLLDKVKDRKHQIFYMKKLLNIVGRVVYLLCKLKLSYIKGKDKQ